MKKKVLLILTAGTGMTAINMIVGQILYAVFPSLYREYNNPSLFRPWSDPVMSLFFLYPFILAVILTAVWKKTGRLFTGKTRIEKALKFGSAYWLITNITGMLISYSTFPVSLLMIAGWSINSLITIIAGAYIIIQMNKYKVYKQ